MTPVLPLPRLVFGFGALSAAAGELAAAGMLRPLLISDRGLEQAGAVASALTHLPDGTARYLDVPENPTAAGADGAYAAYRQANCDGVVALGGGSVIDTAKIVAALAGSTGSGSTGPSAAGLIGRPELIGADLAPLVAIPTTTGTGSESSPVSAMHLVAGGPAIGTRSPRLVPRVAICDPDLARTLPPRLVAATGMDALSHCLEGFFAEPANPIIDALALDGLARAFTGLCGALEPAGDDARASLMAAAFAGGAAIHKGLGPAHAIALACGDQDLHHGVLVAAALPLTVELVARHAPAKAARAAAALGLGGAAEISAALRALIRSLGLPVTYCEAGYKPGPMAELVDSVVRSPFNQTSPYVPTLDEYGLIVRALVSE